MLFLLGQRAAKIAFHDSQDSALVVSQTQPLGLPPRPYDQTGLALALSRCHAKSASGLRLMDFQAAATASRHVVIAAARSTRCD